MADDTPTAEQILQFNFMSLTPDQVGSICGKLSHDEVLLLCRARFVDVLKAEIRIHEQQVRDANRELRLLCDQLKANA